MDAAKAELQQLEKMLRKYPACTYEDVYNKLHETRKKLVHPVILPDEELIQKWEADDYARKGFSENMPEYYTDKGERVRSKAEILIANALYRHQIPYHYEKPLYLDGYGMIHPDFTILNVRLRKELYWEHMGMMDCTDYAEEALNRIVVYEKHDIFPGEHLILSHETQKRPIHSKMIETYILKYCM